MSSQPSFGAPALTNLAERIEYESWLLEEIYTLAEQELFPSWPDAVIYPVDASRAQFFAHMRGNIVIGDWRPGFLNAGAPLVFVSTFKLLDMFIEWVLEQNGVPSTFRFQQKLDSIKGSPIFPTMIESRVWLRERLIGLYGTLEPLRGTIIHGKQFTVTDGAIRVSSSKKGVAGPVVEIGPAHLRKLARTIVSILRYVDGTWKSDQHREKILRRDLDEIALLHGLPLLGQEQPFHTCVRLYLTGSDPLRFDLANIRADLFARYTDQDCSFDLRILMVRDGGVAEAYFLPWSLFAAESSGWEQGIDLQQYRTVIPSDIQPEHLRNGVG